MRLSFRDDVYFAIESISPRIISLSFHAIEEQITISAQDVTRIGDAHTILASGIAFFGARIHSCDELPANSRRVDLIPGPGIEIETAAIAGIKVIDLRSAAIDMPGICIDLGDFDGAAKVHQDATSIGVGVEEEVVCRVIFTSRQMPVR